MSTLKMVNCAIILSVLLKITLNSYKCLKIKNLHTNFKKYINEGPNWAFHEKQDEIIKLFQDAGINYSLLLDVLSNGADLMSLYDAGEREHLPYISPVIIGSVDNNFYRAIGVYKKRIMDSINLFYWIESILSLSKKAIVIINNIFSMLLNLLGIIKRLHG